MDFWNIDFDFLALLADWQFVLPEDLLETARNFARLAVSTCAASTVLHFRGRELNDRAARAHAGA